MNKTGTLTKGEPEVPNAIVTEAEQRGVPTPAGGLIGKADAP